MIVFSFYSEQGGFLGGWIITKLLKRGEDFHHIRLIDLNPPTSHHPIVQDCLTKGAQFFKVDITDPVALQAAFAAPWSDVSSSSSKTDPGITVFHTAANIRFYERHISFLGRSTRINVQGTKNVVSAAQFIGATVLVYTSSGSVGIKNTRLFLWPWEKEPEMFLQVLNDDDAEKQAPRRHEDFFSNYAASKMKAETFVRAKDKESTISSTGTKTLLRTGCIRPAGIFGPGGDQICGAYLMRQNNLSWIFTIIQSYSYVENCAVAHLLFEQRLIELLTPGSKYPDIGGQSFCITDPGPTPTNGDVYTVLETLSGGECHFSSMSPTAMLLLAHAIEFYYRIQQSLFAAGWNWLLPEVSGDLINLQPSLFSLACIHLVIDDSRARQSPEKGGLGYVGAWTTTEGIHKTFQEHINGLGRSKVKSDLAGVGLNFGCRRKKKAKKSRMVGSMKIPTGTARGRGTESL